VPTAFLYYLYANAFSRYASGHEKDTPLIATYGISTVSQIC
jgi:hypothetical protein